MLILTACAAPNGPRALRSYMQTKEFSPPRPDRIEHCRAYGCAIHENFALSAADRTALDRIFAGNDSPAREREAVARAVGLMERIAGAKTGSARDRRGTFVETGPGQTDCADESANTTLALLLFQREGWLKYHDPAAPELRYPLFGGGWWVHETAVMREKKTGQFYAVDSWFRDNGRNADIVPLALWRDGWRPPDLKGVSL